MSTSALVEAKEKNHDLQNRLSNMKKVAERSVMSVMGAGVAVATGAALGMARGYNEKEPGKMPDFHDVPYSVLAAVGMHAAAIATKSDVARYGLQASGNAAAGVAACDFFATKAQEWHDDKSGDNAAGRVKRVAKALGARGRMFDNDAHAEESLATAGYAR